MPKGLKYLIFIVLVIGLAVALKVRPGAQTAQAVPLTEEDEKPLIKAGFPVIAAVAPAEAPVSLNPVKAPAAKKNEPLPGDYYNPGYVPPAFEPLSSNWNLSGSGIDPAEFGSYLSGGVQPSRVVYFNESGMHTLYPLKTLNDDQQSSQTWYYGSPGSSRRVAEERKAAAGVGSDSHGTPLRGSGYSGKPRTDVLGDSRYLAENSFSVAEFEPGLREDGSRLVPLSTDYLSMLQGPDYSMDNFDPDQDPARMKLVLSHILSLGYGGELTLRVDGGYLNNEDGFDFVLYENVFRVAGGGLFSEEFAEVGVSNSLDPASFKWFDCRPSAGVLVGCLGAVPTNEGGDQFDLGVIGVKSARYVKIRDLGQRNQHHVGNVGKWPTEGVDVDAMRVLNGVRD